VSRRCATAELVRLQVEAGERSRPRPARTGEALETGPGAGREGGGERRRRGGVSASAAALPPALEALVVTARGRAGGGLVRQGTRALCWLVPCPEAHLLLLDWVWGGGRPAPVLGAMLDSLAGGNLTVG